MCSVADDNAAQRRANQSPASSSAAAAAAAADATSPPGGSGTDYSTTTGDDTAAPSERESDHVMDHVIYSASVFAPRERRRTPRSGADYSVIVGRFITALTAPFSTLMSSES